MQRAERKNTGQQVLKYSRGVPPKFFCLPWLKTLVPPLPLKLHHHHRGTHPLLKKCYNMYDVG